MAEQGVPVSRTYIGQLLLVASGGAIGSAARYALAGLAQRVAPDATFPYGTLAVNVLGCLAIGFLGGAIEARQALDPGQRLFLMLGVLGGFTTYSAFAYETLGLAHGADFGRAILNVGLQVVLGLLAAWLGYLAAQNL